jgi:hypothetical protein
MSQVLIRKLAHLAYCLLLYAHKLEMVFLNGYKQPKEEYFVALKIM